MSSRKYESGFQKCKKKQRIENLTQSQKGSMDRFVIKESQVSSVNQSADPNQGHTADNEVQDVPTNNINIGMDINGDNIRDSSIDINVNTSPIRDGCCIGSGGFLEGCDWVKE
jgi:hypothetical protein